METTTLLEIFFLILTISRFLGSGIATITPQNMILSTPEECYRDCILGEEPRNCYYHFTLELHETMSSACELCKPNNTNRLANVPQCECIEADGVKRKIVSINKMLPGPSIQVCENDKIIVDVRNNVDVIEFLHWRGIQQYSDGVLFSTLQFPIFPATTFRYEFRARGSGTHFYHSHASVHMMDGVYGSLIVRDPPSLNPHMALYDKDLPEHVIIISDWIYELALERFPGRYRNGFVQAPENVLINGKGSWTDPATNQTTSVELASFEVQRGTRYRFRMINYSVSHCQVRFSIAGHTLTLIAPDGNNVLPAPVDSITILPGKPFDFVVNANCAVDAYWIQVRPLGRCYNRTPSQYAILRYAEGPAMPATRQPDYRSGVPQGLFT